MTLTRPWAIDAAFPNPVDARRQLAGIYPREGVFPDPTTILPAGIAFAGAGWAISARPFVAALKRGGAPYSQAYGTALVSNDSLVAAAWTVGAAPASGSRIDRLCVRARDTTQGDSATGAPADGPGGAVRAGLPEFMVAAGTAGTPGVAPALPAGYEEIAQITVSAGNASAAAATIVQTYSFANVLGGTIYVRNLAERNALTGLLDGDDVYVLDLDVFFIYVAGAWRVEPGTQLGRVTQAATINTVANAETFIMEVSSGFELPAGQKVRINVDAFGAFGGTTGESRLRYSTNNTLPTTVSPILPFGGLNRIGGMSGSVTTRTHTATHVMATAGILRVAFTFVSTGAAGGIFSDPFAFTIVSE